MIHRFLAILLASAAAAPVSAAPIVVEGGVARAFAFEVDTGGIQGPFTFVSLFGTLEANLEPFAVRLGDLDGNRFIDQRFDDPGASAFSVFATIAPLSDLRGLLVLDNFGSTDLVFTRIDLTFSSFVTGEQLTTPVFAFVVDAPPPAPAPAALALFGMGLAALALRRRA